MHTTLLIMAAGLGSRYGGNKQIDRIGPNGEILLEYSIYDALAAGFDKVVFVIKRSMGESFRAMIGDRIARRAEVHYAYQEFDSLPGGFVPPEGRTKPYGTVHAVLAARDMIHEPFAVINADDYYGPSAFQTAYDSLTHLADDDRQRFMMVGYHLLNTLTDHGHVARGVCEVNAEGFPAFLEKAVRENPLKGEYFLPSVVSALLDRNAATVQVRPSHARWYGVTYK